MAVLPDTGSWVALLCRNDTLHRWALERFRRLPPALFSCEAVEAETCLLLARSGFAPCLPLPFSERGGALAFRPAGADRRRQQPVPALREGAGHLADAAQIRP
jgi:predicted nucleic acid-binding protein